MGIKVQFAGIMLVVRRSDALEIVLPNAEPDSAGATVNHADETRARAHYARLGRGTLNDGSSTPDDLGSLMGMDLVLGSPSSGSPDQSDIGADEVFDITQTMRNQQLSLTTPADNPAVATRVKLYGGKLTQIEATSRFVWHFIDTLANPDRPILFGPLVPYDVLEWTSDDGVDTSVLPNRPAGQNFIVGNVDVTSMDRVRDGASAAFAPLESDDDVKWMYRLFAMGRQEWAHRLTSLRTRRVVTMPVPIIFGFGSLKSPSPSTCHQLWIDG